MRGRCDRHVTLAVPGLLGPAVANGADQLEAARLLCEGLSSQVLERFFARSSREPAPACEDGLAAMLFGCFGVVRDGPDWPVAAVTRCVDAGGEETRWVLRADPVHLRAAMADLVLADDADLRIDPIEAESLAAEINAELGDASLNIEALAAKRWYMCLDEPPRLVTRAPWDIVGAPVSASLPGGADGSRWRALINDMQMILHASPVNRARAERGEPAINSVWPWGGGYTPRVPSRGWQAVWGGDTLIAGLARLAGTPSAPLPADGHAWLGCADSAGRHLLVLSEGYAAARSSDVDGWRRFIGHLEEAWMAPLVEALAGGRVASVELRPGAATAFRLARRGLRQWWRRPLPLARVLAANRRPLAQQK